MEENMNDMHGEETPRTGRCTGTFRYQRYRGGIRYDRNQKYIKNI